MLHCGEVLLHSKGGLHPPGSPAVIASPKMQRPVPGPKPGAPLPPLYPDSTRSEPAPLSGSQAATFPASRWNFRLELQTQTQDSNFRLHAQSPKRDQAQTRVEVRVQSSSRKFEQEVRDREPEADQGMVSTLRDSNIRSRLNPPPRLGAITSNAKPLRPLYPDSTRREPAAPIWLSGCNLSGFTLELPARTTNSNSRLKLLTSCSVAKARSSPGSCRLFRKLTRSPHEADG